MKKIIKFNGEFYDIDQTAEFRRIYKISRDERNNPVLYIFTDKIMGGYGGEYFSEDFQERKKTDIDQYDGVTIRNLQDVLNYTIFATADREKILKFADHILDYETYFSAPSFEYLENLQATINEKSTPKIEKLKIKIFDRMEKFYRQRDVSPIKNIIKYRLCRYFLNQLFNL
jgi:hypothetical protein